MQKTKSVTFAPTNETRSYTKPEAEIVNDLQMITDVIVDFLNRTVDDVMVMDLHSPQSDKDVARAQRKIAQVLKSLLHSSKSTTEAQVVSYLDKAAKQGSLVKDVISATINDSNRNNKAVYGSMVLIMVGLESFLKFNHCLNQCYKVLEYSETEDEIRVLWDGKKNPQIKDACLNAHSDIEKALGIDDIRKFDAFLRMASSNHCSLLKKKK
jgi:hypothetical protein